MPITQAINSKANIKKFTNSDLPFSTRQPVINSHYETSTASQSVINLPFSVDQANTDAFFLYVDGKLLRLGASNDYIFTAIDSNNTSSQVTLNTTMVVDLNIQAFKLGSKAESEFLIDNRFQQVYEAQSAGFQAFVNTTTNLLTATATAGAPSAGLFYSSISNRSSIVDISQNLKANIGFDPFIVQSIYQIQTEVGPANEAVWGSLNDTFGQIRFVGGWSPINSTSGALIRSTANITDFVEFTFYGTGVILLTTFDDATRNAVYSIDGGAESADIFPASLSGVLVGRNYAANQMVTLATGLTLGVHTVRVRNNTASNDLNFYGFLVLNDSSLVKVNPGISYNQDKKATTAAQSAVAYNTGVTGTRGGRMLIYQNADGTIGRSFQAVDASQLNLTAANHANEEVARVVHWREFGSNRSDDWSTLAGAGSRAGVLEDGSMQLSGSQGTQILASGYDTLRLLVNGGTNALILHWVGTGLDVLRVETANGSTDTVAVFVDNVNVGNLSTTASTTARWEKIVSGLPYGSHTIRFNTTGASLSPGFVQFKVYQPKKPALPSGAVELAEYNVVADFAAASGASIQAQSQGTIRKSNQREISYVGTFAAGQDFTNVVGGNYIQTSTATNYMEVTFWGTGFVYMFDRDVNRATAITVAIDGVNYTGAGATFGGGTWTPGTSTLNPNGAALPGCGFYITGLALGKHTIRFTNASGNFMSSEEWDIITPIHAFKFNNPADLQNTLPQPNASTRDSRKFTPVKDAQNSQKSWSQAQGIQVTPSTSSTVFVPMPDMSLVINVKGNFLDISYAASIYNTAAVDNFTQVFVNGVAVGTEKGILSTNAASTINDNFTVPVSPGFHKVDLYWKTNGGVLNCFGNRRTLRVKES